MKSLKSSQFFIASSIALLFFAGIFITEQARFNKEISVPNPFKEAETINEVIEIGENEDSRYIFTKDGEFLEVFPDSALNFKGASRELVKGKLFFSANFIGENDKLVSHKNFVPNFDPEQFSLNVGQIKVGKIVVSIPGASSFIIRDNIREETIVYAHDHAISIFLPGAETPFVLPPRNKVKMKDSRIERTGKLFYTKLKKEFQMSYLNPSEEALSEADAILISQVKSALVARDQQFQLIENYAQSIALNWSRFKPSSAMGTIMQVVEYLQRHYAAGIDKQFKREYQFNYFRKTLIDAFFAFENNNISEAQSSAEVFAQTLKSHEWNRFLIENPDYAKSWEIFSRSQRIWLRNIFPDEPEQLFNTVWFPQNEITSFAEFKKKFTQSEQVISRGFSNKAQENFQALSESFETINDITTENREDLTRIRRLLFELLKYEPFLRNESSFKLYGDLVVEELSLYLDNNQQKNEISLETAQNILFFLKEFIDIESAKEISQILVRTYKRLDIDKIATEFGRDFFTSEETETIELVQFINNSKLSEEDLENIREQQSLLQTARWKFQEIEQTIQENQNPVAEEAFGIQDEEGLEKLLFDSGINTQGVVIRRKEKSDGNTFLLFSDVSFNKHKVSGTFQTQSQIFSFLKVGTVSENSSLIDITADIFPQMLARMSEENNNQTQVIEIDEGPANNTDTAIVLRTLVVKTLESQNVVVSRNDVTITNNDFTEFEITNAILDNQYRLEFIYNSDTEKIGEVNVQSGRNQFKLEDESFNIKTLNSELKTRIEEQLSQEF